MGFSSAGGLYHTGLQRVGHDLITNIFTLFPHNKLVFKLFKLPVYLVAQMENNLPAMLETLVQPLGWEDPLEMGMATH